MTEPKQPFTIPAPVVATEIPLRRESQGARNRGPNLFLEPHPDEGFPEGWLAKSYDDGSWYDVGPVPGGYETDTARRGKNKGAEIQRMSGMAAEVTRQLREAANELGIGVSIKYFPVLYKSGAKKGQEIPGQVLVKYLGINRKQKKANQEA